MVSAPDTCVASNACPSVSQLPMSTPTGSWCACRTTQRQPTTASAQKATTPDPESTRGSRAPTRSSWKNTLPEKAVEGRDHEQDHARRERHLRDRRKLKLHSRDWIVQRPSDEEKDVDGRADRDQRERAGPHHLTRSVTVHPRELLLYPGCGVRPVRGEQRAGGRGTHADDCEDRGREHRLPQDVADGEPVGVEQARREQQR